MVKTMEKFGIPAVHICTIVPISQTVGANRIVPGVAIPHPTGDPKLEAKDELELRKMLMLKALNSLGTDITEQTVFN